MDQKELEEEQRLIAVNQIKRSELKAKQMMYASSTTFGRQMVSQYTLKFAEFLKNKIETTIKGRATSRNFVQAIPLMLDLIQLVDPERISIITLKSILDSVHRCEHSIPKAPEVVRLISARIEDEARATYYINNAPKEVVKAQQYQLDTLLSNPSFKRKGAKIVAEKKLKELGWDNDDLFRYSFEQRNLIGYFLLELSVDFGLVERRRKFIARNNSPNWIFLSQDLNDYYHEFQRNLEYYAYKKYPLINKPLNWKLIDCEAKFNCSGGYHTELLRSWNPLCKGERIQNQSDFSCETISLINTLQNTAWNIDNDVFQVLEKAFDYGIDIGKLKVVVRHPDLDNGIPENIKALRKNHPDRKEWRKKISRIRANHAEMVKKSIRTFELIPLARKFQKESRFYLSWSADYRSRLYPQQSLLQPQASDHEKSILTFADGCKLDERGELWAAQAVGAAMLGSKVPFNQRTNWTFDNKQLIKAIAEEPLRMSTQIDQADEPWQFLQLAMEWNRVVLNRDKYIWDVPIGADSTASGLQLISAMRRDRNGMLYSNLLPIKNINEAPKDAYSEVLRIAREAAELSVETMWLSKFMYDRKLAKPILMTALYNSTDYGNRQSIRNYFIDEGVFPEEINFNDVVTIYRFLMDASKKLFANAFQTIDWINKLVKIALTKSDNGLRWTTPTNDIIHLIEFETKTRRIQCTHLGKVTIGTGYSDVLDKRKMKHSLAANYIHSYDASLLKSAFKDWDQPIALIHDCLKVLPNDMDRAMERIKKGFINVCSGDPLARLADDLQVTAEELPRLKQGSGRLVEVLDSAYMFN